MLQDFVFPPITLQHVLQTTGGNFAKKSTVKQKDIAGHSGLACLVKPAKEVVAAQIQQLCRSEKQTKKQNRSFFSPRSPRTDSV